MAFSPRPVGARSLSNNSFLETKNATQYPAYSNLGFVVELLTSLHSPHYAYRLEYCLSDRLLGMEQEWARQQGRTPDTGVLPCTSMYATVLRFMRIARDLLRRQCLRSIPACAGEPLEQPLVTRVSRVYPRVCGGTTLSPSGTTSGIGLSPRVRGNRERQPAHTLYRRSIPACAGEPQQYGDEHRLFEVYPRVCGGTP